MWERATQARLWLARIDVAHLRYQALFLIGVVTAFVACLSLTAAAAAERRFCAASSVRRCAELDTSRQSNAAGHTGGSMLLLSAFLGLIVMAIFVDRTPGSARLHNAEYLRHFEWSFSLFDAAWLTFLLLAPLAHAASR